MKASSFVLWLFLAISVFNRSGLGGDVFDRSGGIAWHEVPPLTNTPLFRVIFGQDGFVAVGASGIILASPDGTVWEAGRLAVTNDVPFAAAGAGFVMVGTSYPPVLLLSSNRTDWRDVTLAAGFNRGTQITGLSFANNQFIVSYVKDVLTFHPYVSLMHSDGSWSTDKLIPESINGDVVFGNGAYLATTAVGPNAEPAGLLESTDAIDWALNSQQRPTFVFFAFSRFLSNDAYSSDGSTWIPNGANSSR